MVHTCCTRRTFVRSHDKLSVLMSSPSSVMAPAFGLYHRSRRPMIVLLPEPLGPFISCQFCSATLTLVHHKLGCYSQRER